jgi:hypothetical protein
MPNPTISHEDRDECERIAMRAVEAIEKDGFVLRSGELIWDKQHRKWHYHLFFGKVAENKDKGYAY